MPFFNSAHLGEHKSLSNLRSYSGTLYTSLSSTSASSSLARHAEWEKRSSLQVRRSAIERSCESERRIDLGQLERKRECLRQLLKDEEHMHKSELLAHEETSEQRAERVRFQARALREKREKRREEEVKKQKERQWEEDCDDLRTIDSHFFALHCADKVKEQAEEKKKKTQLDAQKEKESVAEWERLRLLKVKEEEEKARGRREAVIDNRKELARQLEEQREQRDREYDRLEKEKEFTLAVQKMDLEESKRKAAETDELKRRANRENAQENIKLQKERQEAFEKEREEQRRALSTLMEAYKSDTEKQAKSQAAVREDLLIYRLYLAQRREQQAKMEAEMDRLVEEDVKREEKRRDDHWGREAKARANLMQEVLTTRMKQCQERAQMKQEEIKQRQEDRKIIEAEIKRVAEAERHEALAAQCAKAERAAALDVQGKLRQAHTEKLEFERRQGQVQMEQAEHEYQQRLKQFRQQKILENQTRYNP